MAHRKLGLNDWKWTGQVSGGGNPAEKGVCSLVDTGWGVRVIVCPKNSG